MRPTEEHIKMKEQFVNKRESLDLEHELPEEPGREDAEDEVREREVEVPEVGEADRPKYEARKHRVAASSLRLHYRS